MKHDGFHSEVVLEGPSIDDGALQGEGIHEPRKTYVVRQRATESSLHSCPFSTEGVRPT